MKKIIRINLPSKGIDSSMCKFIPASAQQQRSSGSMYNVDALILHPVSRILHMDDAMAITHPSLHKIKKMEIILSQDCWRDSDQSNIKVENWNAKINKKVSTIHDFVGASHARRHLDGQPNLGIGDKHLNAAHWICGFFFIALADQSFSNVLCKLRVAD